MVVDLAIGVGGVLTYATQRSEAEYMSVTFSMRALHIALDTVVLYGALGETKFVFGSGQGSSATRGSHSSGFCLWSAGQHHVQGSGGGGGGGDCGGGPAKNDGGRSRVGGGAGATKNAGTVAGDCERGNFVPPTARAPSASTGGPKRWPAAGRSAAAVQHGTSHSTPQYNSRVL